MSDVDDDDVSDVDTSSTSSTAELAALPGNVLEAATVEELIDRLVLHKATLLQDVYKSRQMYASLFLLSCVYI